MVCQVLRARGASSVAIEAYSQPTHRQIIRSHGLSLHVVPVDARGAVVGHLADAGAALLTPAHQFPLGMTLAPERRTQAVEWAVETGAVIIEDDYDGEFRYDRRPVGAMQALAPEHVIYAGTASKTLAPGLRLGWLALPAHLVDQVAALNADSHHPVSSLEQLTLAEFISSGAYDRHVRGARLAYRRRRDRFAAAMARELPSARVTGTAAGLHALVELPDGHDEKALVAQAARRGVAVEGLGSYRTDDSQQSRALVVGYAAPPEHQFTAAVARLAAALAKQR
jgi:GntR family transcriptional regulator/MocR family aminotransferase